MTDIQAIRERAKKALEYKMSMMPNEVVLIEQNIPALLAEVERLKPLAELGELACKIVDNFDDCKGKFNSEKCCAFDCGFAEICAKRAEIEGSGK